MHFRSDGLLDGLEKKEQIRWKVHFLWYKLGAKQHQTVHADKQHFQQAQFIFTEYVFFSLLPTILVSKIDLHFTAEDCGRTAVMVQ